MKEPKIYATKDQHDNVHLFAGKPRYSKIKGWQGRKVTSQFMRIPENLVTLEIGECKEVKGLVLGEK